MSLTWTESFAGLAKDSVDTHSALRAAGYIVDDGAVALQVKTDAIVPGRVALTVEPTDSEEAMHVNLGRVLPPYTAPVIIGFSFYVPMTYGKPVGADSSALLSFRTHEEPDLSDLDSELFVVRRDLAIGHGAANPQNAARMTPARVHYVEIRIAMNDVRVWLDDVFVLQHTDVVRSPLGWSVTLNDGTLPFAISNLYSLTEDSVYPNVRLGRATRVIGERPTADVSVDFERPVDAASNAAVAAQDMVEAPPAVLQGTKVGDSDLYVVSDSGDTEAADKVHAVVVKARSMNADVIPRAIAPYIEVEGVTASGQGPATYHKIERFTDAALTCAVNVPGYGVLTGTDHGQIWFSPTGEAWDSVAENVGASITDMVVINNVALATCSDGKVLRGNFSVTPPTWVLVPTPIAGSLNAIAASDTMVMAVGAGGAVITSPSGDIDTWATRSSGLTADLTAVTHGDGDWYISSSFLENTLRVSLNDGASWLMGAAAKPAIGAPLRMRTLNGKLLALGTGVNAIASRLVLAGHDAPFFAATKLGNYSGSRTWVDAAYTDDLYVAVSSDGKVVTSDEALLWQRSFELDVAPRAVVVIDYGRVLIVGEAGSIHMRATMPAITTLPVLSGYVSSLAVLASDPSTGVTWTPLAAALANIGVRIEDVPLYGDTGRYLLTERGLRILDENGRKILLEDFTHE